MKHIELSLTDEDGRFSEGERALRDAAVDAFNYGHSRCPFSHLTTRNPLPEPRDAEHFEHYHRCVRCQLVADNHRWAEGVVDEVFSAARKAAQKTLKAVGR